MTDILLFAAGFGTRMGALTKNKPKPLIKVAGTTLLDHALHLAETANVGQKVVNIHYCGDQIRDHLQEKEVSISDETALIRDTGGGLRHALPLLHGSPVLTLNTDAVWVGANPIPALLDAWTDEMACLLLLVPRDNVHGHKGEGDFITETNGQLTRGPGAIYSGLQLVRPALLDEIEYDVFSMNRVWDIAEKRGTLYGIHYDGAWCDVGQPESIPIAEALIKASKDV